ncbi:MAG: hypothetical protein NVSMB3_08800 [Acidobacteriaceae bacterium]
MGNGEKHPYNEAGRRMKAALVSYQLGMNGVDYVLRRSPEVVEEAWAELAEKLLTKMAISISVVRKMDRMQ